MVNANAVQVQTDSAALGEVVNGEQVQELPLNGRNFVALTLLQPGVSAAECLDTKYKGLLSGVDFSVNGNATTSNLFLVDGANNNDAGSNRTILIYPSIEAISEFKMLRNAYGAEYGQASGAVINIVTRSGSNQWHGDVLYFGRNDALNAYEYFAASTAAQARAQGTTLPNGGKDVLRRNDFGYSLGGPIKKDKLFFFLSQEWNIERRGQTRQSCVPTAAERAGNFTTTTCGEPQPTGSGGGRFGESQYALHHEFDQPGRQPDRSGTPATEPVDPAGRGSELESIGHHSDRLEPVQCPFGLQHQPLADTDVPVHEGQLDEQLSERQL